MGLGRDTPFDGGKLKDFTCPRDETPDRTSAIVGRQPLVISPNYCQSPRYASYRFTKSLCQDFIRRSHHCGSVPDPSQCMCDMNPLLASSLGWKDFAYLRCNAWDQGKELTRRGELTIASDLGIYFCDPH